MAVESETHRPRREWRSRLNPCLQFLTTWIRASLNASAIHPGISPEYLLCVYYVLGVFMGSEGYNSATDSRVSWESKEQMIN